VWFIARLVAVPEPVTAVAAAGRGEPAPRRVTVPRPAEPVGV
jgi:hypothetical protein